MRYAARRRVAVSSIVGSIFFVLIMVVAIGSLVTIFNSFTSYNQQVTKASNANLQAADTELSVSGGQFGAFPPSTTSNFNVATACTATATSPTNREKVFYASDMWWDLYTCNGAFQYSSSFDGVTWGPETSIPGLITSGYTVGPYFDVEVSGSTIYVAVAEKGAAAFQLAIGTLVQGGSDSSPSGTISWTDPPANVVTTAATFGPINMAVDGSGDQFLAVAQGTCTTTTNCALAIYEHEACATTSNDGWEPNACTSTTNPTNYAPAALGTLSANVHTIFFPAISSYSSVGVILLYETGSATASSTGTLGMITQTALATTTWNTIALTGLSDYSLTSSSGTEVGTSLYFAGLANVAVGATTGTLDFWSVSFSSMTAGTVSAQQAIEGTTAAWMGALASDGSTLALFDNPAAGTDACPAGDTCVQYYTTGTLGSKWSSAILLESAETAVTYLAPASGELAVTWTNSADNVRFAALSTFTLSNDSPFGVHVVDAYVYNPSTGALVAHWFYNTTGTGAGDFDWWVGQGSTTVIPLRFIWAADTSYLITFATDSGVTAQTTLTTLPGGTVSCSSGQFFYEISPNDLCASAGASFNPILLSGSSSDTCTDTSASAEMMGLILSYTTGSSSSGSLFLSYSFQVASPATSGVTSTWQVYYGSGTAPACGAATTGTALGEPYTVRSQAAVAKDMSQSVSAVISSLAPSTTYWFDVQVTDSSTGAWVYSNPDGAVVDVQTANSPTLSGAQGTATCTDTTTTTTRMMGFGGTMTFTTPSSGFGGSVFGKLSFNVAGPATAAISSRYTIAYGTGTAPACNAAAAGTATGEQYTVTSQAAVASGSGQKSGFVLTGLASGTTYWVDLQVSDTSGAAWVYSNPTLAVMMMPTATNSLPYASDSANTNTCTDSTASTLHQAGFGVGFNIPSSAEGSMYVTLTFEVTAPASSGVNTQWQMSYDTGAPPTCNQPATGLTPGNTYVITSQSGTYTGAMSQSETFVIQDTQKLAGTTIWVDIQVYPSSAAGWTFSNPSLAVAEFPV